MIGRSVLTFGSILKRIIRKYKQVLVAGMNELLNSRTGIKLGLFSLVLVLTIIPVVSGYSSSQYSAETVSGSTSESWDTGDNTAWYKVMCYDGNYVSNDVDLDYIEAMSLTAFDPSYYEADNDDSSSASHYHVAFTVTQTGYHNFELYRSSSSSSNYIYISITGATRPAVPGYSTLIMVVLGLGITLALALRILKKKRLEITK